MPAPQTRWTKIKKRLRYWQYRFYWETRRAGSTPAPVGLNLEPTNACNLRCTFCSYDPKKKMGLMDLALFDRLTKEAAEIGVLSVNLYLSGEPTLHPGLPEMVRMAGERGLFTYVHTNAVRLNPKISGDLVEAGLDSISFSVDDETKAVYEAGRVGATYEKTIENIKSFLEEKKKRRSSTPNARIQLIRNYNNGGDGAVRREVAPEFKAQFDGLPLDGYHQIFFHNMRGEVDASSVLPANKHYFPCFQLWNSLSVAWDGKVVGCCADLNSSTILGDLNTQSILEVWRSDKLRNLRKLLIEGRHGESDLCKDCSHVWFTEDQSFKPLRLVKGVVKDLMSV